MAFEDYFGTRCIFLKLMYFVTRPVRPRAFLARFLIRFLARFLMVKGHLQNKKEKEVFFGSKNQLSNFSWGPRAIDPHTLAFPSVWPTRFAVPFQARTALRGPQIDRRLPKTAPRAPKSDRTQAKTASRALQSGRRSPKTASRAPKIFSRGPKTVARPPLEAAKAFKTVPQRAE